MTLLESTSLFSYLTVKSELAKYRELLKKSKSSDDTLVRNGDSYSYLEKIANLENMLTDTASKASQRALDLKDQLDGTLKLSNSIQQCWAWLHQTSQMAQLHMKNASTFHLFHAHASELRKLLDNTGVTPSNVRFDKTPQMILYEIERKSNFVRDRLSQYLQLWQKSDWLVSTCYTVIPIDMRHQKVQQPTKVISLCNYETVAAKIAADETLLLLDNTDPLVWTVKIRNGEKISIPSVACLIPGPDQTSVEMAVSLQESLCEKWKEDLITIQVMIVDLLQYIHEGIKQNKISIRPNCVEDLRAVLTDREDDFYFDCDEPSGTKFSMIRSSLCDYLNKMPAKPGADRMDSSYITLSDVVNIRGLLSSFKDHVRGCCHLGKALSKVRPPASTSASIMDQSNQTDVEKLFNRMSLSSNGSLSTITDTPDDTSISNSRSKCVSRLHWNLSNSDSIEKFVTTTEVQRSMPISFPNDKVYCSSENIAVTESVGGINGGLLNYSVRFFEVHSSPERNLVDGLTSFSKDTESVSVQTDPETDSFSDEFTIKKVEAGRLRAAIPTRSGPETCHSFTQTSAEMDVEYNYSWTQTDEVVQADGKTQTDSRRSTDTKSQTDTLQGVDMKTQTEKLPTKDAMTQPDSLDSPKLHDSSMQTAKPVFSDSQVCFDIERRMKITQTESKQLSYHKTQTENFKREVSHRLSQTPKARIVDRAVDAHLISLVNNSAEGMEMVEKKDGRSQTDKPNVTHRASDPIAIQTDERPTQTSPPSRRNKAMMTSLDAEREMKVTQTDYSPKLCHVKVQTPQKELSDGVNEYVVSLSSNDTQTLPFGSGADRSNSKAIQTGNLSYEILTRVVIEGEEPKEMEVLQVLQKSGGVDD